MYSLRVLFCFVFVAAATLKKDKNCQKTPTSCFFQRKGTISGNTGSTGADTARPKNSARRRSASARKYWELTQQPVWPSLSFGKGISQQLSVVLGKRSRVQTACTAVVAKALEERVTSFLEEYLAAILLF